MSAFDEASLLGPILLAADNFTPLTRTPWAGLEIGKHYKSPLVAGVSGKKIGESWEFSCDPDFPSRVAASPVTLQQLVQEFPEAVLGKTLAKHATPSCEILVKLLNPSAPLSLQVHPRDDDAFLKPNECGKPESWLVLRAEKGAGLYLGFSKKMTREELRAAILTDNSVKELLHFVPVKAGDYFEIEPGVPHLIGPGVTLLEPQRILFGKSGKTYRLWDWGRKYDAGGNVDLVSGKARELHLEAGLKLVDPQLQVGEDFVRTIKKSGQLEHHNNAVKCTAYPKNPYYQVMTLELAAQAGCKLQLNDGYAALVMLEGAVTLTGKNSASVQASKGQPVLLPCQSMPLSLRASERAHVAVVVPSTASWSL